MSSGRRQTVLIFCISSIKELYLASIEHYDPDMIYVFINKKDDKVSNFERDVFESSLDKIGCNVIAKCVVDTHDYECVLANIIEIKSYLDKKYGDDLDLFINITSGTHEFAAAGMFASMLPKRATAFRVEVDDDTFSCVDIGNIVGNIDFKVSEPVRVSAIRNNDPEEDMVIFLSVLDHILRVTKYPKFDDIIERLKAEGGWTYDPEKKSSGGRTPLQVKEERYLKRHYIAAAVDNGWIERPSPNTMRITDSGKAYISVYGAAKETSFCCSGYDDFSESEMLYSSDLGRRHPAYMDECKPIDHSILFKSVMERSDDNVIQIENNGKRYRFRVDLE